MRTVDASLTAALAAGAPTPYLKAYAGEEDGTLVGSTTNVISYRLTGTSLEFVVKGYSLFSTSVITIWLERGLTLAGTPVTVTTGRFFVYLMEALDNQQVRFKADLFPHEYYTAAGDLTYETVIDALCTAFGKTTTYKDDTEAWLGYQFLPTGQNIIVNDAMRVLNLLHQKRLISVCDNGGEDVRIYSADVMGASVATVSVKDAFSVFLTSDRRRQYIWRDEAGTLHTDGTATDPLHNLGYLESTDSPPARNVSSYNVKALIRPDLRFQDGDVLTLSIYGGALTVNFFAQVTEEFDSKSSQLPKWRLLLEANPIYHATEGGALPSTIERVSNYTPLNTSNFNGILSTDDNNLQAMADTVDDHEHNYRDLLSTGFVVLPTVPAASTRYAIPFGDTLSSTGLAMIFPYAGTIKNLRFGTASVQPGTGSLVVTVRKGGVDTAIVATCPAGGGVNIYSDTTHTVAVVANNYIDFKIVNNAPAAASAQISSIILEFELETY